MKDYYKAIHCEDVIYIHIFDGEETKSVNLHLGIDEAIDDLTNAFDEAVNAGMNGGDLRLSWDELEPLPGSYDLGDMIEALEDFNSRGFSTYVNLGTIDIGFLEIPEEFENPENGDELAPFYRYRR